MAGPAIAALRRRLPVVTAIALIDARARHARDAVGRRRDATGSRRRRATTRGRDDDRGAAPGRRPGPAPGRQPRRTAGWCDPPGVRALRAPRAGGAQRRRRPGVLLQRLRDRARGDRGERARAVLRAARDRGRRAHATARAYAELDDPAFQRAHVRFAPDGLARSALYLEDLRCAACVWLVESAPRCVPGVVEVSVDLGRGRADVTWDPAAARCRPLARYLDRLGHVPHPYRGLDRDAQRRREDRALLVKLGVAGAAIGNVMLLAIALYAGLFGGMSRADATRVPLGVDDRRGAGARLRGDTVLPHRARRAARAAACTSIFRCRSASSPGSSGAPSNVLRGRGEIYFDSLAMLVFLLLVARWIVLRHQRRASSAAELLLALTPSPRASRRTRGHRRRADRGDRAGRSGSRVLVGEVVPVDGDHRSRGAPRSTSAC